MYWQDPAVHALIAGFQHIRSYEDMRLFLADLLSESEIVLLAKKFQAADMLNEGVPYARIARETELSSATIAKVARKMSSGNGGLLLALMKVAPLPPHRDTKSTSL